MMMKKRHKTQTTESPFSKFSSAILSATISLIFYFNSFAYAQADFFDNFLDYQNESLVNGVAKLGSQEIGALKYGGQLDPLTHKALHAIVGGLTAEFSGSDFASGALGAVVAETIGELYFEAAQANADNNDPALLEETRDQIKTKERELGRKLTLQESIAQSRLVLKRAHDGRVTRSKLAGKIAAIGTAFASGQDVGGANKAAVNAVENNLGLMKLFTKAGKAEKLAIGALGGTAIAAGTADGLAEGELGGTIMGSILWTYDELLDKLTDYVGCEIAALTLLVRIVTDAEFREKFMVKLFEQDKAAGVNECARPEDAPKPRPIITPMPDPWEPLPGFAPSEIEKKPLITPIPNDDDDGVACGGIPIHEPKIEDYIVTKDGERHPLYDQLYDKKKDGVIERDEKGRKINGHDPKIIKQKQTSDLERARDNGLAENANAKAPLRDKLSRLENAAKDAEEIKILKDGRTRYYEAEEPSDKPGQTRGAALATEHNPKTGQVRVWLESRDHDGNVIRINPKSIDGQTVRSLHYPLTGKEVANMSKKSEDTK